MSNKWQDERGGESVKIIIIKFARLGARLVTSRTNRYRRMENGRNPTIQAKTTFGFLRRVPSPEHGTSQRIRSNRIGSSLVGSAGSGILIVGKRDACMWTHNPQGEYRIGEGGKQREMLDVSNNNNPQKIPQKYITNPFTYSCGGLRRVQTIVVPSELEGEKGRRGRGEGARAKEAAGEGTEERGGGGRGVKTYQKDVHRG